MSVAFVTMVYNDEVFLDFWLRYYDKHTSRENMHVITHGPHKTAHEVAKGCVITECPRDPNDPSMERGRFQYIVDYCSALTESYDRVIYNDVDELIVLDPEYGDDLVSYLENIPEEHTVVTPVGVEIIHRPDLEADYDHSRPLLSQRKFSRLNAWFCKPCITNAPIIWGPDGHGCSHPKQFIDPGLYLFHLKWFDRKFHTDRYYDRQKMRFLGPDGKPVVIGVGSWSWSALNYRIVTNQFLSFPIISGEDAFDFTPHKKRLNDSYAGEGMYKSSFFVEQRLRVIPERFVGTI